ncbi:hypothetical protein EEL31_03520 [Brevibacillus laterosporus]|uniref:Uncharacterized protein n=1 Tax=Brevibacillus laterosporus TaxID=1465 RepID=A0A518V9V1_BRELA|nr:hypothetical protein EEL30_16650 [Brevibacillus laterosporus]TPG73442.1 hypothetical protein EEL31_03520 [Brevibacillus laterosporus]
MTIPATNQRRLSYDGTRLDFRPRLVRRPRVLNKGGTDMIYDKSWHDDPNGIIDWVLDPGH